jgi:hypothetical protein
VLTVGKPKSGRGRRSGISKGRSDSDFFVGRDASGLIAISLRASRFTFFLRPTLPLLISSAAAVNVFGNLEFDPSYTTHPPRALNLEPE